MPWWLPLAIVGGAKVTSQAIQNKRDRKERLRAEKRNESRQANYYTDLVKYSQRAGFNPLTVLRAGGGMGYSNLAGRITQPLMTTNPFSAGIDAAANFWASTYRTPHQKEMDKLNKEALRSDINLSRAQTASLQYELKQQMAPPIKQPPLTNTTNIRELSFGGGSENNGSATGGYFLDKAGISSIIYPPFGNVTTSASIKPFHQLYTRGDGTIGITMGEEVDILSTAADQTQHYSKKLFDKFAMGIPNVGILSWSLRQRYLKAQENPINLKFPISKDVWDLAKIRGFLSAW
jgi:hypothetical protein